MTYEKPYIKYLNLLKSLSLKHYVQQSIWHWALAHNTEKTLLNSNILCYQKKKDFRFCESRNLIDFCY